MLLLVPLLAAAASAQPIGDMPVLNPRADQPANCPATSRYEASKRRKGLKLQKLNELPDADVYRAVYRHIGPCEAPMIMKFGLVGR